MTHPSLGAMYVDPARMGGPADGRRHAFGNSRMLDLRPYVGQAPVPQQAPPAPPAPRPEPAVEIPVDIAASVRAFVDVVETEAKVVRAEFEAVLPQTVRAQPTAPRAIPGVGDVMNVQQLRTQVIVDARALIMLTNRALTGSLAPYLSSGDRGRLEAAVGTLQATIDEAEGYDLQPVPAERMRMSEQHTETHMRAARELLENAERAVVAKEGDMIDVREPAERAGTILAVLVVGAVAAVLAFADL